MMSDLLKRCLDKLENMINEKHLDRTRELQKKNFSFEKADHIPLIIHYDVPDSEWPDFNFEEIYHDKEKMLLSELKTIYCGTKLKDDRLYGIRANYGTGIIASTFGCPVHTFEKMLPCATDIGGVEAIYKILEYGVPDIYGGVCGRALETVAYFKEALADYPLLSKNIKSSLLDIQGTFDNASIIWGSDIYLYFYEEPELVKSFLGIITDTIRRIVFEHRRIDGQDVHLDYGSSEFLGGICLRNDSCINLSGEFYEEFVKPFDNKLLSEFTGSIHFCGKAHQWWEKLLDLDGLTAINPYQGEYYDLIPMYDKCRANKIAIFQWTIPLSDEEREYIKTGFSQILFAPDYDEARRLYDLSVTR